jgi:murein DD-endopeptidase MepM/ murein hydrolase activator NlpD
MIILNKSYGQQIKKPIKKIIKKSQAPVIGPKKTIKKPLPVNKNINIKQLRSPLKKKSTPKSSIKNNPSNTSVILVDAQKKTTMGLGPLPHYESSHRSIDGPQKNFNDNNIIKPLTNGNLDKKPIVENQGLSKNQSMINEPIKSSDNAIVNGLDTALTEKVPSNNPSNKKNSSINGEVATKKQESPINNTIANNNKEIIENIIEVSEDDILKAYALPNLKVESTATETIIEEKPQDKINKTYNIQQKIKDMPVGINERSIGSRIKIIKPVNKGVNVQRNNNKQSSPSYHQELLEDGREIKRSFTIQENTSIAQFLVDNGVEENKAESFNNAMKDSIVHLNKGQYVIIKLEKIAQYFKQHKPVVEGQYNLKKMTIFFNNCVVVFIFKKGRLVHKKYYVDDTQGDFSVINCEKLEDFDNLVNLQSYFSKKEYDFLSQSIDYLSNKLFHQKIKINSIKLVCQKVIHDNKITQRIRGLFVYTPKEKYYCYIYKDFADNYHLLSGNGNSFNLEVLDVQSNPPIDGRVSSLFGNRKHPVLKRTRHHGGLDLSAPHHTPVYAVLNGWVLSAGQHKSYGNYIIISYGNMIYTLYGHLSKIFVKTGDYVETGRLVGSVGSTGLSSGPHLHYEIFQSDVNFYTINDDKINLLFANRTVLDPGLRYKIGIGLRTVELNYFLNLVGCLHKELKGIV